MSMDMGDIADDYNRDEESKVVDMLEEASILIEKCIVTTTLQGPRERIGRLYHLSLALHSMAAALQE